MKQGSGTAPHLLSAWPMSWGSAWFVLYPGQMSLSLYPDQNARSHSKNRAWPPSMRIWGTSWLCAKCCMHFFISVAIPVGSDNSPKKTATQKNSGKSLRRESISGWTLELPKEDAHQRRRYNLSIFHHSNGLESLVPSPKEDAGSLGPAFSPPKHYFQPPGVCTLLKALFPQQPLLLSGISKCSDDKPSSRVLTFWCYEWENQRV